MSYKTRSTTDTTKSVDYETFFSMNPTGLLREKMKNAIVVYLEEMSLAGKIPLDEKGKKDLPMKVADRLKDLKLDGWINLQCYHKVRHTYRMYRSLCDLVKYQLRIKMTPQKSSQPDVGKVSPEALALTNAIIPGEKFPEIDE